jgi:hypothetical protein
MKSKDKKETTDGRILAWKIYDESRRNRGDVVAMGKPAKSK